MEKPFFVDIMPVFSSDNERNVNSLNEVYKNTAYLNQAISTLIGRHINPDSIKGKNVLLKPNWVKHSLIETDDNCLRTNNNFLLAVIEVILQNKPESMLVGDAPIQGCKWDKVLTNSFLSEIESLSKKYNIPVRIKDFRRVTFDPSKNQVDKNRSSISEYVIFDVGKDSYLEPITNDKKNLFRVNNYDPDRLAESHRAGVHKYCITKELFEADIIFSLPKVKTHQKAGITAALKNLVGLNGDKDYLPHHRIGGTEIGGDCYPGKNKFRFWSELALDFANRRQGKISYWFGLRVAGVCWRLSFPKNEHQLSAGWYGNDTTWRMVMDLNKIAIFGNADGTLSTQPRRQVFSLCDGIIGGQGDGPLNPEPMPLGVISFTNYSGANDLVLGTLMGLEIDKIPLLKSFSSFEKIKNTEINWNNKPVDLVTLKAKSIMAKLPPGWQEYSK
jgi:uncharacterized protein (DUF362 family)